VTITDNLTEDQILDEKYVSKQLFKYLGGYFERTVEKCFALLEVQQRKTGKERSLNSGTIGSLSEVRHR
jgi:hypothetical protein